MSGRRLDDGQDPMGSICPDRSQAANRMGLSFRWKRQKTYTSQNNNTVKKGSVQRSHMGSQFIHSEKNDILSPKEGRIQSVCVCPFFDDKTKETRTTAKPILSVGLI